MLACDAEFLGEAKSKIEELSTLLAEREEEFYSFRSDGVGQSHRPLAFLLSAHELHTHTHNAHVFRPTRLTPPKSGMPRRTTMTTSPSRRMALTTLITLMTRKMRRKRQAPRRGRPALRCRRLPDKPPLAQVFFDSAFVVAGAQGQGTSECREGGDVKRPSQFRC